MGTVDQYTSLVIQTLDATISNGQTKSNSINMSGTLLKTILLPAAFTGSTLTFEVSEDNSTFLPYYNINNMPVTIDISTGRAYGLGAIDFYSIKYLKIVSGSAEAAERTIKLIARAI